MNARQETKNNFRILKKNLCIFTDHFIAHVKFIKDRPKNVGGVAVTRYILQIRDHAPRITHHGKPKTSKRRGAINIHWFLSQPLIDWLQILQTAV